MMKIQKSQKLYRILTQIINISRIIHHKIIQFKICLSKVFIKFIIK